MAVRGREGRRRNFDALHAPDETHTKVPTPGLFLPSDVVPTFYHSTLRTVAGRPAHRAAYICMART